MHWSLLRRLFPRQFGELGEFLVSFSFLFFFFFFFFFNKKLSLSNQYVKKNHSIVACKKKMTRYHRRSSFLYVYTCVRWKNKKYRIRYFLFFFVSSFYFFLSFFFFIFLFVDVFENVESILDSSLDIFFFFLSILPSDPHT